MFQLKSAVKNKMFRLASLSIQAGSVVLLQSTTSIDSAALAILQTNDRVRIDLKQGLANILISAEEIDSRFKTLAANGGFPIPQSQTPWQEIFRERVTQFDEGMIMKGADKYQKIATSKGVPRHNH